MDNQGYKYFLGSSMLPTIKTGAKIKYETVKPEEIKIGDIVIFNKKKFICHRIVGKYKVGNTCYFWEKGDNYSSLNMIGQDKIIGRVTEISTVEKNILKGKDIVLDYRTVIKYKFFSAIYRLMHQLKLLFFQKRQNRLTKNIGFFLERMYSL